MQFLNKKVTIITVAVLLLCAGVWLWMRLNSADLSGGETRSAPSEFGITKEIGNGLQSYTSEQFGFRFTIPSTHTVGEFDEAGGRMVLVNAEGGETMFQIFVAPFNESGGALTAERIQAEIPSLTIREPENMSMTGGQSVLTFVGEDASFGVTREVWMVHKGNLLQIVSTLEKQEALAASLETWELF